MKDWKSIDDQLALLKSRRMTISEPVRAKKALEQFGYYRLSGYWYPFKQANDDETISDQFRCHRIRCHRKVCSLSNAKEEHFVNLVDFASLATLSGIAEVQ